nr:hypothetical protein [Actinospica robiniae]
MYWLFRRWQLDGVWRSIVTALQARADAAELITWDVSVDSTIARAHQHAAGARRGWREQVEVPAGEPNLQLRRKARGLEHGAALQEQSAPPQGGEGGAGAVVEETREGRVLARVGRVVGQPAPDVGRFPLQVLAPSERLVAFGLLVEFVDDFEVAQLSGVERLLWGCGVRAAAGGAGVRAGMGPSVFGLVDGIDLVGRQDALAELLGQVQDARQDERVSEVGRGAAVLLGDRGPGGGIVAGKAEGEHDLDQLRVPDVPAQLQDLDLLVLLGAVILFDGDRLVIGLQS